MKLALECPTALLEDIQPLADFDWILAHLVLQDREYAQFYSQSTRMKILDNSTNELLEPCSLSDIAKTAEIVKPDYIVAPDYLGDHLSTEKALDEAVAVFGLGRVFPVVQGHTLGHVLECTEYIAKTGFNRVAVPYDLTCNREDSIEKMASAREEVVSRLILLNNFEWIHLLGMTTLEELESYRSISQVKSIDTGSPVLNGLEGLRFGKDALLPKKQPTMSQMEAYVHHHSKYGSLEIYYNIAYLRKVLMGGIV